MFQVKNALSIFYFEKIKSVVERMASKKSERSQNDGKEMEEGKDPKGP